MIKVMIFDLDMCILNTHTLTGPFFQPVLDALYSSELSQDLKERIQYQLWTTSLDDTMEMFSVPENIVERMREAYRQIEVPDGIKTFGGEEFIRDLPVRKILVTTGYRKFQETKIEKIGVADLFDEIICINDGSTDRSLSELEHFKDRIVLIDLKDNRGKGNALAEGVKKAKNGLIS